jgi:hypothetical protein
MAKPAFIKPDARGVDQLTPDGRRKVLLDTAEGLNRQQVAEGIGVGRDRLVRMIKAAQKGPLFYAAWGRALQAGKERRALEREAKAAIEGPKAARAVQWVLVKPKPDDLFAQAMAGRRFGAARMKEGPVISGRTYAWVAL